MDLDISGSVLKIKSPFGDRRGGVLTVPVVGAGGSVPVQPAPAVQPVEAVRENNLSQRELLQRLGERFNTFMRDNGRELEFQVRDQGGNVVIVVRQSESGEVVRTIPPDEARRLAQELDQGGGVLLSRLA